MGKISDPKKGDKRKFFGIWFTYTGKCWTNNFIPRVKNFIKYMKD